MCLVPGSAGVCYAGCKPRGVWSPRPPSFSKRNRCALSEVKIWTPVNIKLAQTASHRTSGTVFEIYFKRRNRHCTKWPHLIKKKPFLLFSTCVQCRIKDLLWSHFCFMLRTWRLQFFILLVFVVLRLMVTSKQTSVLSEARQGEMSALPTHAYQK